MIAKAPIRLGLGGAGLAALIVAAVWTLRTEGPEDTAVVASHPLPCSGCDARHARLKDLRTDPLEEQE
jgi:hypothetical protein